MNTLGEHQLRNFSWAQTLGYGYGYGVRTMMHPEICGGLSSVGEFGWGGAAGVQVIIDPDRRLTLVYTQHMLNNQTSIIFPRLRNIIYSCLD
jgi:CubicO group peptidase (beta-lactamase class C family)